MNKYIEARSLAEQRGGATAVDDKALLLCESAEAHAGLNVPQLIRLCKLLGIGSGVWRAGANRDGLLSALGSGSTPPQTELLDPIEVATKALSTALAAVRKPQGIDKAELMTILDTVLPDAVRRHSIPSTVRLVVSSRTPIETQTELGRQHYKLPLLLACAAAGVPSMLVGSAGSGKTTVAATVANLLKRPFSAISVGPMTSKGDLFGQRDASGVVHESLLAKAAENGGVFLMDEIDAGNAGVLTSINMLLANGHFATPSRMVTKSASFVFIAGANTYGNGASRQYVGRNQLDKATLDRFGFIDWPVDEGLEASLCGVNLKSPAFDLLEGGLVTPETWHRVVLRHRRAVERITELRIIISPRASIYGVQLCNAVGLHHLEELLLWKGATKDERTRINAAKEVS